jgi:parallel beta-helix repeat protein
LSTSFLDVRSVAASSLPISIHNAIAIHSDTQFTVANGVASGSGSATDPYVIENWNVNVQASSVPAVFPGGTWIAGILVANTTAHVIIRNVQVYSYIQAWGQNLGIVLWNTTNVRVESSLVFNGNTGVLLQGAKDSTIVSNRFINLIEAVEIVGGYPFEDFVAARNVVSENTIDTATGVGVSLLDASDNLIVNNSISNVGFGWGAFIRRGSVRNVFSGNHINSSAVGIEVIESSLNNTVSDNFFDVQILGVGVGFGSNGTIVSNNEIHSMRWGINMIAVQKSTTSQNTIQSSEIGINLLRAATMNTITGNTVTAHIGIFVCGTEIGYNRIAPPPNDLRSSDQPIEHCSRFS